MRVSKLYSLMCESFLLLYISFSLVDHILACVSQVLQLLIINICNYVSSQCVHENMALLTIYARKAM